MSIKVNNTEISEDRLAQLNINKMYDFVYEVDMVVQDFSGQVKATRAPGYYLDKDNAIKAVREQYKPTLVRVYRRPYFPIPQRVTDEDRELVFQGKFETD